MRTGLVFLLTAVIAASPAAAQVKNAPPSAMETAAEDRDDIELAKNDDPDVNAAIAEAKRTTPAFLTALNDPDSYNITFKYPLGGFEHIWVDNVRRDGAFLTGNLANDPVQEGWKRGDAVRVPAADLSDYFYCDADGAPHGHFTTIVFIDRDRGKGYTAPLLPRLCETRVEPGNE